MEKQIDEAVWHVHDPLNGLPGAVVPGKKIEFFRHLVVNGDGTLKSQNQQHHVMKTACYEARDVVLVVFYENDKIDMVLRAAYSEAK